MIRRLKIGQQVLAYAHLPAESDCNWKMVAVPRAEQHTAITSPHTLWASQICALCARLAMVVQYTHITSAAIEKTALPPLLRYASTVTPCLTTRDDINGARECTSSQLYAHGIGEQHHTRSCSSHAHGGHRKIRGHSIGPAGWLVGWQCYQL